MFNTIINPTTNRKVQLHSATGHKILNNYIKQVGGVGWIQERYGSISFYRLVGLRNRNTVRSEGRITRGYGRRKKNGGRYGR